MDSFDQEAKQIDGRLALMEGLIYKRDRLQKQIEEIHESIKILEANPQIETVLNLIAKHRIVIPHGLEVIMYPAARNGGKFFG